MGQNPLKALDHQGLTLSRESYSFMDIVCQYIIYILDHIGTHLLASLSIDQAIGLLHVHSNKDECFFCYAMSFIPESGIVASDLRSGQSDWKKKKTGNLTKTWLLADLTAVRGQAKVHKKINGSGFSQVRYTAKMQVRSGSA